MSSATDAIQSNNPMTDPTMDISQLEQQVEQLIGACSALKQENTSLRQRQESLVSERAELIEKTELARNRVEAMISRLKAMENGQ
jgi:cell division protein ZapB